MHGYHYNILPKCIDTRPIYETWQKLSIEVNRDQEVHVSINGIEAGSFRSHFSTRGHGGPMLTSNTNLSYRSKFRHFKIKGTNLSKCT